MYSISSIQIIGAIFVLFAWSRVYLRYRDDSVSLLGLILWSVIWLGMMIVLFIPETTELFAKKLGIGRGVDAFLYGSIVILFYLVYRLYVKIESLDREITQVVREESLRDLPKKNK